MTNRYWSYPPEWDDEPTTAYVVTDAAGEPLDGHDFWTEERAEERAAELLAEGHPVAIVRMIDR